MALVNKDNPFANLLGGMIAEATSRRRFVRGAALAAGAAAIPFASVAAQDSGAPGGGGQGTPPDGGQGGGPGGDQGGGQGGDQAVTDEFVGVTTDGNVIADLFAVQDTGVSTQAVVDAATAFIDTFAETAQASILFAVDDVEWRQWSNVDSYSRQGISLRNMTEDQKAAAMALIGAGLSADGLETSQNIMKLNHVQGELMNNLDQFDEDLYYFTIMGTPSTEDPWGFQVDGHHLVINYFVLGNQVTMTPTFMGSEPVIAPDDSDYAGIEVMQEQQKAGLVMINALDEDQQAEAIISPDKTGDNMQAGAFQDNLVIAYQGVNAADFTDDQKATLLDLVETYVGYMADSHAAVRMEEVRAHIDDTWLAWIGGTDEDSVFYYRIQSPVVLIEFDHQQPGPLGQSDYYGGSTAVTQMHIHTIIRTPNGNDYGKALLAEHYATSAHHAGSVLAGAAMVGLVAAGGNRLRPSLPDRYLNNDSDFCKVQMAAGPLVYGCDGRVAWDEMWIDFCDLALAGGPPHRETMLFAPDVVNARVGSDDWANVQAELRRGLRMVSGWEVETRTADGWIGLIAPDDASAFWMANAIETENVASKHLGRLILLPCGADFRLEYETRNVISATAKAHHYLTEHLATLIR